MGLAVFGLVAMTWRLWGSEVGNRTRTPKVVLPLIYS